MLYLMRHALPFFVSGVLALTFYHCSQANVSIAPLKLALGVFRLILMPLILKEPFRCLF